MAQNSETVTQLRNGIGNTPDVYPAASDDTERRVLPEFLIQCPRVRGQSLQSVPGEMLCRLSG